ncbi:MAG: MBL fold metallo-hydrolase [Bacteroidetes bacterium]|nr:MBL fold metallo-hydrolase [Bacteroidota bacterium]
MTTANDNRLKVTFLGTGTSIGVPVITCDCPVCQSSDPHDKRMRTSVMLEVNGFTFVIDCGPDFRIQMLRENVNNLDAVIFTHEHRDHIAGLDDIRAFNYVLNKKIDIYGTRQVMEAIQTEFPYIFSESRYFGAPQLTIHPIDEKPFTVRNVEFIPIKVLHEKLPVTGFRVGDFTYITDASFIPEKELEKIKGSKVIVLNALRNSRHVSHFSVGEAVDILTKLNPEAAYLTHLSHFVGLHDEVNSKLPDFIRLAFDGLTLSI